MPGLYPAVLEFQADFYSLLSAGYALAKGRIYTLLLKLSLNAGYISLTFTLKTFRAKK